MAFAAYLEELLKTDPTKLSTKQFRFLFDAFAEPLQEHLADEIQTISDLRAYAHTGVDLMKYAKEAADKSTTATFVVSILPALLLNHDRMYEGGFSPGLWPSDIPGVVSFAVRKVGTCWYWGRWKFTCCDGDQMPRELVYMDFEDRVEEKR
jgi:hypothetical protein